MFKRPDLKDPVSRFFCKNCGTAIGTQSPKRKDSMILKVGTLDNPSVYKVEIAIFTVDIQPFHHIPDDIPSYKYRP
ncbi:MAG: GFA family protein [Proteobacteria bacterium]|nr:GFA family protein [Pseudomonadota bacterium]